MDLKYLYLEDVTQEELDKEILPLLEQNGWTRNHNHGKRMVYENEGEGEIIIYSIGFNYMVCGGEE